MNANVADALRSAIKIASDCDDLESVAALSMVRAAMLMEGAREVYELIKPLAERLLNVEQSWPTEIDARK